MNYNATLHLKQSSAFKPNDLRNDESQTFNEEVSNSGTSSDRYTFYDLKEQNNTNTTSFFSIIELVLYSSSIRSCSYYYVLFNCFAIKA